MNGNKILIWLLLFSLHTFSQKEYFFDSDSKEIKKQKFLQKYYYNKRAFFCEMSKNDSIILFKLKKKYEFGIIDSLDFENIKSKYWQTESKSLLVYYKKNVLDFNEKYSNYDYNFSFHDTIASETYNKKQFGELYNKWTKKILKESEKLLKKHNLDIVFAYNSKFEIKNSKINWVKANSTLKKYLKSLKNKVGILLIRNNGEYFISRVIPEKKLIDALLKKKNWSKLKIKLKKIEKQNDNRILTKPFFNGYGKRKRYFTL